VTALGGADELISSSVESDFEGTGESAQLEYFPETYFSQIEQAAAGSDLVDGVAPIILEPIAVQNPSSRQSEPRATLLGTTAAASSFAPLRTRSGELVDVESLGPAEVLINDKGADELQTRIGDSLTLYTPTGPRRVTVKAIIRNRGVGTADGPGIVMTLASAQEMLAKPGQIKHIVVSNRGGNVSGAGHSNEVAARLQPTVERLGLGLETTKKDDLATADVIGNTFTEFFVIFGFFSISAGILLIFLIFIMLAAERRSEMGISRAIGAERNHLVRMFVFEGLPMTSSRPRSERCSASSSLTGCFTPWPRRSAPWKSISATA
jgi:putative ABC transport system permease protein